MPTEVVVDSSIFVSLVTPEEQSAWSSGRMQRQDYPHVLDLNYYEVANAIKYKIDGTKFGAKDAVKAFTEAVGLMNLCALHSFSEIVGDAIALALELDISVYDAAFLALAERHHAHLLTLNTKLEKKTAGTKYRNILECPSK